MQRGGESVPLHLRLLHDGGKLALRCLLVPEIKRHLGILQIVCEAIAARVSFGKDALAVDEATTLENVHIIWSSGTPNDSERSPER